MVERPFCSTFSDEFDFKLLNLEHKDSTDFVKFYWNRLPQQLYSTWRLLIFLGMLAWCIMEWYCYEKRELQFWFLFATNWTYMLYLLTNFALGVAAVCHTHLSNFKSSIPGYKVLWFMYIQSSNAVLITCLGYWLALADDDGVSAREFTGFTSEFKHSATGVLVLCDVLLGAIPVHLVHVFYLLPPMVLYTIFTYVFWETGHAGPSGRGYIYPIIKWDDPGLTLVIVVWMAIIVMMSQLMLFCAYRLRVGMCGRCCRAGDEEYERLEENSDEKK